MDRTSNKRSNRYQENIASNSYKGSFLLQVCRIIY